jgi:hypothetical protein
MATEVTLDLSLIPDEDLRREYMRRLNATRRRAGGRPVQLKACPNCGEQFSSTNLRLVHLPQCRREVDPRAIREAMNRSLLKGGPSVYAADTVGRGSGQWVKVNAVKERKGFVFARDVATGHWFEVNRWEVRR